MGGTELNPYFNFRTFDYGPLSIDRSQSVVFNYIYAIPNVGSHLAFKPASWVLDRWSISGITTLQTGAPYTPTFSTTNGANITGSAIGPTITVVGNPKLSHPTFQEAFNTAAFALTPIGRFGNAGPGILREPGLNNWDLSLTKRIPLRSEARFLQFRAEAFNAWNHPQFVTVNSVATFNPAGQQTNPDFGQYSATGNPRIMQLSVRLNF